MIAQLMLDYSAIVSQKDYQHESETKNQTGQDGL